MIVGLYFIVVMIFLHSSGRDCGFITFYKAARLTYNGRKIGNKVVVSVVNKIVYNRLIFRPVR